MAKVTKEAPAALTDEEIEMGTMLPQGLGENPGKLKEEFVSLPGLRSSWRVARARAVERQKLGKLALDREVALARLRIKGGLTSQGNYQTDVRGIRVTADDIDAKITVDPAVKHAQDALVKLEVEKLRLDDAIDSMGDKKEMLISLGAQVRTELEGDAYIRSRK